MVFVTAYYTFWDGITPGSVAPTGVYCINDETSSNYGTCYIETRVDIGRARFVQADTSAYPVGSLPCEVSNTCVRYTDTRWTRTLYTVFNYGSKQAIFTRFSLRTHGSITEFKSKISYVTGMYLASPVEDYAYSVFFPSIQYELTQWPIYIPNLNMKAHFNPYRISYGNVAVVEWGGNMLTPVLYVGVYEDNRNNIWYSASGLVVWAYESSPLAIIPLDYDRDYVQYQELRNAFGFSINGVDQPGWNADDIMNVLRELFPDRAWAVFDDRTKTLHLYNLTPDYVPDWLVEKLVPVSMKAVKAPVNAAVAKAWMDELSRRNVKIPAQTASL